MVERPSQRRTLLGDKAQHCLKYMSMIFLLVTWMAMLGDQVEGIVNEHLAT